MIDKSANRNEKFPSFSSQGLLLADIPQENRFRFETTWKNGSVQFCTCGIQLL